MDILKAQADLAKLQAEITWVFAEVQKTNRARRWWTEVGLAVVGAGVAAASIEFAKLFLH
jgi:hypothetical protein